jgi:hypothetical protein
MPTQQQIAEHLDLDQSAVSRMLDKLGFSWKTAEMDEIRKVYIRHLRAQASGHRSDDGMDLVRERVLTERVDRELKLLQVAEKRGQLVNVEQLEPQIMNMVGAFRAELLARDDKLASELSTLYEVNVDVSLLNEHTFAALGQLARYDPGRQRFAEATGGESGAAGENEHDRMGAPV